MRVLVFTSEKKNTQHFLSQSRNIEILRLGVLLRGSELLRALRRGGILSKQTDRVSILTKVSAILLRVNEKTAEDAASPSARAGTRESPSHFAKFVINIWLTLGCTGIDF